MRVTSSLIRKQIVRQLSGNLTKLAEAQQRLATGIRVGKPSDDPIASAQLMRVTHALRGVEMHQRSVTSVRTRMTTEEGVLDQITDILARAKEITLSQATDTATQETRRVTAAEMASLLEQVIAMGNSSVSNEFIFGGGLTDAPPFTTESTVDGGSILAMAAVQDVTIDNGDVVTPGGTFTITDGDDGDSITLSTPLGATQTLSASALVGVGGVLDFDDLGIQITLDATFALSNAGDGAGTFDAGTQTIQVEPIGTYIGDATVRRAEIADGQLVETNQTGQGLLVDSKVIDVMAALRDVLRTGGTNDIQLAIFELDDAFQNVQVQFADIGARTRQLDRASDLLAEENLRLNQTGADLQNISLDQASVEFFAVQTALDAARLAGSRVLNQSLTDFLR